MVKNILIIQLFLPSYRVPVFSEISELTDSKVTVFAGESGANYGENDLSKYKLLHSKANWKRPFWIFYYDSKIFKLWKEANIICHVADYKFVSLWAIMFLNLFTKKKMFIHGQGGYKKEGIFVNIVYSLGLLLSDGYICYTEYSRRQLKKKTAKFLHSKITVCDNTLVISPVDEILEKNVDNSILYLGRIRKGCDIEVLLEAAANANVNVKVIGSSDDDSYMDELKLKFGSFATFYGAIFDEDEQKAIAKTCMAGAYGGDAGLSVVHYMSLGLPVIVHGDIGYHMGPEPSYVTESINGLLFERKNVESLTKKILLLSKDDDYRRKLAMGSLQTFHDLASPTMAYKFSKIFGLLE